MCVGGRGGGGDFGTKLLNDWILVSVCVCVCVCTSTCMCSVHRPCNIVS